MYKHFTAANEYFVESKASMEYEPELVQALDTIFVGVTEVQRQIRDRAKLGSTAATSVPITLTGKKPKRSDILGRWSGLPKRDARLIPLPQPIFDNPAEDPSLPDYIFQRRAATSTVTMEASSVEGQPGPSTAVTTTAGKQHHLLQLPQQLANQYQLQQLPAHLPQDLPPPPLLKPHLQMKG